jgi:hypothetical protein
VHVIFLAQFLHIDQEDYILVLMLKCLAHLVEVAGLHVLLCEYCLELLYCFLSDSYIINVASTHKMSETPGCITIFVEIPKEKAFMKQVFLFKYSYRYHRSLFSSFLDQNYITFFYKVDKASSGLENFLCRENFFIVKVSESTTDRYLDYQIDE